MGLPQSHNPSRGFARLIKVDLGLFFLFFPRGYPSVMTHVMVLTG